MRVQDGLSFHRRSVLQGLGGSLIAAGAGVAEEAPTEGGFHHTVAATARTLTNDGDTSLVLLCPDGAAENLRPVVSAFRQLSGVQVQLKFAPPMEISGVIALQVMSGASDFDLALPATFALPDLISADALLPLDQLAAAYEPKGFRDGILYRTGDTMAGKTYGFQADGDVCVMFYRGDMLADPNEQKKYSDTYGHALSVPQTWQEFDRQIGWFHRPDEDRYGGFLMRQPGHLAWEWWARFHSYGVWPLTPDMNANLAAPEGIAALEDMIRSQANLHPGGRTIGLRDMWERFSGTQSYCTQGWGGTQKIFHSKGSALRGKLVYGPAPGLETADGSSLPLPLFNWGWSYVVSRSSERSELAYLFALFASTPEMSLAAVREKRGFFDPVREEHYVDPVVRSVYSVSFLEVHRASLRAAIPDFYLQSQSEYFRVLNEALSDAFEGRVSPEDALIRASQLWEMITSRTGRAEQAARWRYLRAKYPDAIADQLRDPSV